MGAASMMKMGVDQRDRRAMSWLLTTCHLPFDQHPLKGQPVHFSEKSQTFVPSSKAVCKGKLSQCLFGQPTIVELDAQCVMHL